MFEQVQQDLRGVRQVFATSRRHWTTGRQLRSKWRAAQEAGERIVLDDFGPPIPSPGPDEPIADFSPKTGVKDRKSHLMTLDEYPSINYAFEVKNPPVSGNHINGLGETEHRRASPIFHTWQFGHPMGKLEFLFQGIRSETEWIALLKRQWLSRRFSGEKSDVQVPVDDPAAMTEQIKQLTRDAGAVMVGIAPLTEDMLKEEHPFDYPHVISFGVQMDREAALQAPSEHAGLTIQSEYRATDRISAAVAKHIREMGWDAEAAIHSLIQIPAAIEAGLGQLGKHGSMISKELGSMYRLGAIVTNLPLVLDSPEDIGVDDFCARCQVCTTNCPPHAIFDTKQMVRGRERWYVDFDTCIPYFVENHGCGICIGVCPWSEPGRGEAFSIKQLALRKKRAEAAKEN
ncbi:MAG: 4Fe-4S dicluster domain-containing protein [Acidimicrobiales bacterium]|nr:4Fe-4S dicluster domain-containing protein [Acidimicrobiales bacterium]RZV48132.1 MAG: 4Fe-4S dicluster domain-containing protein [Acidimicrobiales bacterium]